jgi:hypothetical protein
MDQFSSFGSDMTVDTIPLPIAAELQDDLMAATNDLDRLQTLLSDACDTLLAGFGAANDHMDQLQTSSGFASTEEGLKLKAQLAEAVTALQFQDMASQLIAHTSTRLRRCGDRIAQHAFDGDEDGDAAVEIAPLRPNPVTQDEMDAGSVELF